MSPSTTPIERSCENGAGAGNARRRFRSGRWIETDSTGDDRQIHPRERRNVRKGRAWRATASPMASPPSATLPTGIPRAPRSSSAPVASERRVITHRVSGPSTPPESGGHANRMPSQLTRCAPTATLISGPSVPRGGTRGGSSAAKAIPTVAARATANPVSNIVRCIAFLLYRTGRSTRYPPNRLQGESPSVSSAPVRRGANQRRQKRCHLQTKRETATNSPMHNELQLPLVRESG